VVDHRVAPDCEVQTVVIARDYVELCFPYFALVLTGGCVVGCARLCIWVGSHQSRSWCQIWEMCVRFPRLVHVLPPPRLAIPHPGSVVSSVLLIHNVSLRSRCGGWVRVAFQGWWPVLWRSFHASNCARCCCQQAWAVPRILRAICAPIYKDRPS